jgi:hypothetical protein
MQRSTPEEEATQVDRRRSPRVSCAGLARIISLPSDGLTLPGKLRDLSLLGCGIETASPLQDGTRAEILLRVNAYSVRVVGQVRAVRAPYVMGVEFLHVSTSGQDILAELIRELARQQAMASTLRAIRRGPGPEKPNQDRAALLNVHLPIIGSLVSFDETGANSASVERSAAIIDAEIDLFI